MMRRAGTSCTSVEKRLEFGERPPAVVGRLVGNRLVPARAVGLGAAPMPAAGGDPSGLGGKGSEIGGFSKGDRHAAYIIGQCEQIKNIAARGDRRLPRKGEKL